VKILGNFEIAHILPWSLDAINVEQKSEKDLNCTHYHNSIKEIYTYQSSQTDNDILVIQFANKNTKKVISKHKNNYYHLYFPQKIFQSKFFGWQISLSLLRYLIKEKPSIIHYHGFLGNQIYFLIIALVNKLFIKSKLIGHHRGIQNFPRILKFLTFIALNLADFLIAQNYSIFDTLKKKYLIPRSKICVIPNGVSKSVLTPINKNEARRIIGLRKEIIILLWIGRLDKNKNPLKMLKILNELRNNSKVIQLIMIGDGILRDEIESYIIQNNLNERVLLKSWQDQKNLSYFYSACDIFLSTSNQEGFSNVILEAMYHSLPIIAIKNHGNKDLVSEKNGILTENDQNQVLKAIINLLNDKDKRLKMSQNSKNKSRKYDWDDVNNKIIKIYNDLALQDKILKSG